MLAGIALFFPPILLNPQNAIIGTFSKKVAHLEGLSAAFGPLVKGSGDRQRSFGEPVVRDAHAACAFPFGTAPLA
jgi:hypothetical protein